MQRSENEAVGSGARDCAEAGPKAWLSGRRGIVVLTAGTAAVAMLAVGGHWIAAADLVPLLFLLPCAAMMFMCMRGMARDGQTGAATASVRSATSGTADTQADAAGTATR
jgi:hypothetical protein